MTNEEKLKTAISDVWQSIRALRDAEKLQQRCMELQKIANYPVHQVKIHIEVRYFATYNGIMYTLVNDWNTELLDRKEVAQ